MHHLETAGSLFVSNKDMVMKASWTTTLEKIPNAGFELQFFVALE